MNGTLSDSDLIILFLSRSPLQMVSELDIWLNLALNACCQDSYTPHKSAILTILSSVHAEYFAFTYALFDHSIKIH